MRVALALLLIVHGLVHALGFVRAFGLAEVPQLRGETLLAVPAGWERPVGAMWLVAGLALVATGVAVLARSTGWWVIAVPGALLSQLLVVYAWPEARVGTIANVIVLVAAGLAWADARFQRDGDAAIREILRRVPATDSRPVTAADLAALPPPVRTWLTESGVVDRPRARIVRLRQRGQLRTGAAQAFMPAEAEQVFTVDEPAFVWKVRVRMMRVVPVVGRDSYIDGRGRMRIAAAGLVNVVDASGPAIDQGAMLRFLGEIVWFPSAALADYVHWEPVDERAARATMRYGGAVASAVFHFDERGRFTTMTARRYMGGGEGEATLQPWKVTATTWRTFDGVRVPSAGTVTWELPGGDFTYYRWEITALEET